MQLDKRTSSAWTVTLHKELLRGKQVLLHGNVADLFLVNGEYLSLRGFLDRYFQEEGYQLAIHFDIVDGIQFADPARMRALFQQLRAGGSPSAPPPAPAAQAQPAASPAISRRVIGPATTAPVGETASPAAGQGADPALQRPDLALPVLRALLGQRRVPTAVALSFADKLVGDAQHQSGEEPRWLVLLKKMIQEAALIDAGPMRNRRNALVVVAEHLAGVPVWLYQNNPLLKLIHVTRPEREEREAFITSFLPEFHGAAELAEPERDKGVREFADLTDGLTAHDLHAIRRTSVLEKQTIARPRRLIDFYKFGDQEDPWAKLSPALIRDAEQSLKQRVIGQDGAVKAVVEMLITAQVGLSFADAGKACKPKGVFFFVGPTGVGKTELAKALTGLLFSDDAAFARFDMSEYAMEHAAEKLTGSPPGYVGYDEGGLLTGRVLERPFSLLLFDEIEKAHGKIMDKFLQILEDGRLTDSKGQTADFSRSLIIFTSNIGSDLLNEVECGHDGLPSHDAVRQHYLEQVRRHFSLPAAAGGLGRPELLNRLGDNVLVFDMLRPQYIRAIAAKFLAALSRATVEKFGVTLQFSDDVPSLIENLMRSDPNNLRMGGRRVRTLLEERVLKEITRHVFEQPVVPGSTLTVAPTPDWKRVYVS